MRTIVVLWLCLVLPGGAPVLAGQEQSSDFGQLDPAHDRIERRAVVPSADQPQGEVQLVRRGNLLVVQTLLSSRILKRVVSVIDGKEERSWPETRPGYLDSRRYRDELFRATERSWQGFRQRRDRSEMQQKLLIEFILGPDQALIALSLPEFSGSFGNLTVEKKQPLKIWKVAGDYVRDNMQDIIADSFALDADTAQQLLTRSAP